MIGKRSIIFTYLCLFFLGTWGVHRFYLGKWITATIYAATWGVFGLGLIYDFFMIPFHVMWVNRSN